MWEKEVTDELRELALEYEKRFHGMPPDGYEELIYEAMTYDELVRYIKESLAAGKELPDVVP